MLFRSITFTVILLQWGILSAPASGVSSKWALSIGSRAESLLSRNKRQHDYRGGVSVAAVKTMTARQMETLK